MLLEVIIRTNGGTLTIGESETKVAKGQIYHYGVLDKAIVYTETSCFHANGAVAQLQLKAGKVIAEESSILYITEASSSVTVEEKGGKFIIPAGVTTAQVSTTVAASVGYNTSGLTNDSETTTYDTTTRPDSAYEISTLEQLETFRDLVNGGFSFAGCTVKLTADIKLNDGWTPIGEGNRSVVATGYSGNYAGDNSAAKVFKGTFDGQNHIINNLNNKGYVPRFTCEVKSNGNEYQYSYGFFGILYKTAIVRNLKFTNVNIDGSIQITDISGNSCKGDSIAALAGFCDGNVSISGITVESGTIKGTDAVAGIIGRWYYANVETINLNNLVNKADITAFAKGGKAAGLVGYTNVSTIFTFVSCKNVNANITSINENESYADYFMCCGGFGSKTSEIKSLYTFDNECSATGEITIGCPDTEGEIKNKYGVWRWTHNN